MHPGTLRLAAAGTAAAFVLSSCTPLTTQETSGPGPFAGAGAASAASDITRATTASGGEAYATGARVQTAAAAATFIIAKHQATQRQRQVATQRARAAVQKLQAQRVERPGQPAAKKKKLPRYIAVETVKEKNTVAQAKKAVMIWDTQAQDIVGNNVYDIASPPPVGATTRFETYSAEYVGAGL